MSWFSDAMFGKRQRISPTKINDYMDPYGKMIDEQEDISRQMMDPNSLMNVQRQNMLRESNFDMMSAQGNQLQAQGAMTGSNAAQTRAQMMANMNTGRGQMGAQMQGLLGSQYETGLANLQNVMGQRKGEGERLSNMHIQQVNAANAARQSRQGNLSSLLGMAVGMGGQMMGAPESSAMGKFMGGGEGGTGFMEQFGTGEGFLSRMFENFGG